MATEEEEEKEGGGRGRRKWRKEDKEDGSGGQPRRTTSQVIDYNFSQLLSSRRIRKKGHKPVTKGQRLTNEEEREEIVAVNEVVMLGVVVVRVAYGWVGGGRVCSGRVGGGSVGGGRVSEEYGGHELVTRVNEGGGEGGGNGF